MNTLGNFEPKIWIFLKKLSLFHSVGTLFFISRFCYANGFKTTALKTLRALSPASHT